MINKPVSCSSFSTSRLGFRNISKKSIKQLFLCVAFTPFVVFSKTPSCPSAASASDANFCSSFKQAAECHCVASSLPQGMCANMSLIYDRMISTFGSLQRACTYQRYTSVQDCMDDWNCYRQGGMTSQNQLCSNTGGACTS